jgi:hypothetical protein
MLGGAPIQCAQPGDQDAAAGVLIQAGRGLDVADEPAADRLLPGQGLEVVGGPDRSEARHERVQVRPDTGQVTEVDVDVGADIPDEGDPYDPAQRGLPPSDPVADPGGGADPA